MLDALRDCAAAGLGLEDAELAGLALVGVEDPQDGQGDDGGNDAEAPEGPAPCGVLVEGLRGGGAGPRCRDVGRRAEGEGQRSVAQVRRVRDEDVEDVGHPVVANPVEALFVVSRGVMGLGGRGRGGVAGDVPVRPHTSRRCCTSPSGSARWCSRPS